MPRKASRVVLFCCVILLWPVWPATGAQAPTGNQNLKVHFIDVGYGDAALIEFPDDTTILIDAGDSSHSSDVELYLKGQGIGKIDTAVITHPHHNHFEGFEKISTGFSIGRMFHNGDPAAENGYDELLTSLNDQRIPIEVLRQGMSIGNLPASVTLEVLNPAQPEGGLNDNSIVLLLKHNNISMLFFSDVGPQVQETLLKTFPEIRRADLIQIPHHGGPLSDAFIDSFQKKIFVLSTGPNPWGLLDEEQLKKLNGTIYRTDQQGTVIVESDGNNLTIFPWNQSQN